LADFIDVECMSRERARVTAPGEVLRGRIYGRYVKLETLR